MGTNVLGFTIDRLSVRFDPLITLRSYFETLFIYILFILQLQTVLLQNLYHNPKLDPRSAEAFASELAEVVAL